MAAIFQLRRGSGSVSLVDGELYVNKGPDSLQYSVGEREITLAKLDELNTGSLYLEGGISASGDITASNLFVSGNVTLGGTITIGDSTSDNVIFNADLSSSIIPDSGSTYDLGNPIKTYKHVYANNISASFIDGFGNPTEFSESVDFRFDYLEGEFSASVDSRLDLLENAMSGSNRLYVSPEGFDTNDGKDPSTPFKTIKAAVESLGAAEYTNMNRTTIFVGSGNYTEQNPIAVPPGVAIVGDTLRTVRLTAETPENDFFHVHDSNYFYGLRFLDLKYPAFAFSYPCSTANAVITNGEITDIDFVYTHPNYTNGETIQIIVEGPDGNGTAANVTAEVAGGVLSLTIVDGGSGYADGEKPHISIQAPITKRPLITTSPYIQNCSSITGPFDLNGNKVFRALPYDFSDIDSQGAGGGIRIDGNLVHPNSPLESFVADAFTQVNQGGPGHLVINKGYAQFVSCFTTFCTYGFKTANGGFANISNSVIDFGNYGLISKTYYPETYNTAVANESQYSSVNGFLITQDGAGYTGSIAGVTLGPPDILNGTQATAEAVVSALGTISSVYITNGGTGYTSEPFVSIDAPTGAGAVQADATSLITGVRQMKMILTNTTQSVEISSNMILDGANYLVTNVETGSTSDEKLITTYPNPPQIENNSNVYFHKLSNISTGGLVMEYVGSGVTYNALPKFGGVPNRTREITEYTPGKVFYSTVDNIGNLKIGEFFSVNQLTGEVTIDARNFNLSGINQIGPFRRNGLSVGKVLREVSDSVTLVNSQGIVGSDTVPTQYAVFGYVNNYTSSTNDRLDKLEISSASVNEFTASTIGRLNNLELTSGSHNGRLTNLESKSASVDISLAEIHSYTSSLKTAIELTGSNVVVLGDFTVKGTTTTINSTTVNIDDNIIVLNGSQIANGGLHVNDSTGFSNATGSIVWDSTFDYWKAGIIDEESKILLAGGDGVLSGSTDFNAFSTSVDSRLSNLQSKSASVDISISNINSTTESLNNSVSLLNSYTASTSISVTALNQHSESLNLFSASINNFSGNVNSRFDNLQTYTSSVNTKFSDLKTYTGSIDTKFGTLEQLSASLLSYTASANVWSGTIDSKFTTLEAYTSSVNQTTLSLNEFTESVNTKFGTLETYTSSINSDLTSIHQTTASLNSFSASAYVSFSLMTASIDDHEERVAYLEGINGISGGNPLTQLHIFSASAKISITNLEAFTSSANTRLTNLELTSASINEWSSSLTTTFATDAEVAAGYEAQGRGIVSGSSQIVPLLPTGVISGSVQILGGTNIVSASTDSATVDFTITNGNITANLIGGVISGSSQVLGGSTIHSSSVGDYQFNSIGIGTAASTTAGEIRATGDITAFYSSDIRLKENIQPIENALTKVNQISGNTYDWKAGFEEVHSHKGNDVGVIAQEIEAILPQIVTNRDNGYKAVQYEKMIPLLVEAIKELSAKIDRLENK